MSNSDCKFTVGSPCFLNTLFFSKAKKGSACSRQVLPTRSLQDPKGESAPAAPKSWEILRAASESCKEALTPLRKHPQSPAPSQQRLIGTCTSAKRGTSTRAGVPTRTNTWAQHASACETDGQAAPCPMLTLCKELSQLHKHRQAVKHCLLTLLGSERGYLLVPPAPGPTCLHSNLP